MTEPVADDTVVGPTPVLAVVGRPNVGKSTLVNRIIGRREAVVEDRPGVTRDRVSYDATWNGRAFTVVDTGGWDPDARGLFERISAQAEVAVSIADAVMFVVDDVAGTTVDPVDELIELGGRPWRFIDTAGIRKRVKEASGQEYYASLRTNTAIDRAEVAVLVVDGSQPISEQDQRIIMTVAEAGRALVIAFNKWDLVDEERRYYLDREIERDLVRVPWAPRINITAKTGWHVDRLVPALDAALEGWETRIGTGALNAFLGRLVSEHPHPVRGGKQPKVLFATQPSTAPPTFVLFTSGKLEASYLRYIERRLREEFGFVGTPIHLIQKPREKRKR